MDERAKTRGDRIKARRSALPEFAQNQAALADRVGVSRFAVTGWETGRTLPSGTNLTNLSAVLGVSPGWILYGESAIDAFEVEELAERWESDARTMRDWDRGSPQAEVLLRCAADVRELARQKRAAIPPSPESAGGGDLGHPLPPDTTTEEDTTGTGE